MSTTTDQRCLVVAMAVRRAVLTTAEVRRAVLAATAVRRAALAAPTGHRDAFLPNTGPRATVILRARSARRISRTRYALMPERRYHVYVLASSGRVLYVGCTGNLATRMHQHRTRAIAGFTRRYNVHRLVHLEEYARARDAVRRERQLKGWRRDRKIALIEVANPGWRDLWSAMAG